MRKLIYIFLINLLFCTILTTSMQDVRNGGPRDPVWYLVSKLIMEIKI